MKLVWPKKDTGGKLKGEESSQYLYFIVAETSRPGSFNLAWDLEIEIVPSW